LGSDAYAKHYRYLAIGIICLGIGLRLIGLDKGLWFDEYYALKIAQSDNFVQSLRMNDYPPTYFFLLRLWSSLNASEPFLRLLSVFWGILTMIVVMAWVRSFSPSASLLCGLLVATAPILVRYSQEIQSYPLLLFSVACSFYCAHRISSDNARPFWCGCLTMALCVAVTTHMVGIVILPSICVYLLPALWKQRHILRWPKLVLVGLIPTIVFGLTYFLFTVEGKARGWWMPPLSTNLIVTHFSSVLGLGYLQASVAVLAAYHWILAMGYQYVVAIIMALCFSCPMVLGDWRRTWRLLAAAATIWLQILLFSLMFLPIFWSKTIVPGVIPLTAFFSVQATTIRRKAIRFVAVASLVLVSLLSAAGWLATDAGEPIERWRDVGQFLESAYHPGNLVAFYPDYVQGPATYYFPALRDIDAMPIALGTSIRAVEQELTRRMDLSSENASEVVVFVVVYPDPNVEKDIVTFRNLLSHLQSSAICVYPRRSFKGLVVLQYELRR
jgi:hypothetical protein